MTSLRPTVDEVRDAIAKPPPRGPSPGDPGQLAELLKECLSSGTNDKVEQTALWASIVGPPVSRMRVGAEWTVDLPDELVRRLREGASPQRPPSDALVAADFLERAVRLHQRGFVDTSIDLIVDSVDTLLQKGYFALVDSTMSDADVENCPIDVLGALIWQTFAARRHLAVRRSFVARAIESLRSRVGVDAAMLARMIRREDLGESIQ